PFLYVFLQAEDGIRAFHVTGVQTCALPIFTVISKVVLVNRIHIAHHTHSHLLHGHTLDLEEPLIGIEPPPACLGAQTLHPLRAQVVARQYEGHALTLVELRTVEEIAPDHRQVLAAGLNVAVDVLDIAHTHTARRCRRDLHQPSRTTRTARRRIQSR